MFLAAESWKPDVCTSCVCMNSLISCFSESCPAVSCERPVLRKGQCCPYCIGKTKTESFGSAGATASTLTALCLDPLLFVKSGFLIAVPHSRSSQVRRGRRGRCVPELRLTDVLMVLHWPVLLGCLAISGFPRPQLSFSALSFPAALCSPWNPPSPYSTYRIKLAPAFRSLPRKYRLTSRYLLSADT